MGNVHLFVVEHAENGAEALNSFFSWHKRYYNDKIEVLSCQQKKVYVIKYKVIDD